MIKPFPVVSLEPAPRTSRFHEWARQFGIFRLSRSLRVEFRTVRRWLAADRTPAVEKAKEIIALSALEPLNGQSLTFEDIYGPARALKVEVRHVTKVQAWE
jgi:hypothetical protein